MNAFSFLPLVGIAIFVFIVAHLDVSTIASTIFRSDPVLLLLAVAATISLAALKAYRWKVLIRPLGYDCPPGKALKSWLSGFFIGIVTPGRIGDLSRAFYLRKELGLGRSLNTVVVDRVIDIISLLLFALLGALSFTVVYSQSQAFAITACLLLAFSALFLIMSRKSAMKMVARPVFSRIVPDEHKSGARMTFNEFYDGLRLIMKTRRTTMLSFLLSAASILLLSLQYYLIAAALGIGVSYWFMLMIVPLVSVLDALPISLSGMGTRDVSLIFFFSFAAIPAEAAISSSIMVLFLGYVFVGFLGFIFWMRNPTGTREFLRNMKKNRA